MKERTLCVQFLNSWIDVWEKVYEVIAQIKRGTKTNHLQ